MKSIFKLPYGNLTNKIIRLEAKSSREICDYYIDISNIIDNGDRILSILASPNQKSVKIINTKVIDRATFIATILGGDNRTIAGVTFLITTEKGEKRSFNCSIPILSNPLDADCNRIFHMGQPGRAGTIKIKDIIVDDSIDEIIFYNVGTDVDAEYIIKFPSNFNNSGSLETSSKILVSDDDPTDITFPPSHYKNFTLFSKKTNTIWQTELESKNYVWKNKGEFGVNTGSINLDLEFLQPKSLPYGSKPTIETDEDGKILFGIPEGKRGSLWFTGSAIPTTNPIYLSGDQYLCTSNNSIYNYDGTAWILSFKLDGSNGKDGTQILIGTENPTDDTAGFNMIYLNSTSGDLFESFTSSDCTSYTWVLKGNLKGAKGNSIDSISVSNKGIEFTMSDGTSLDAIPEGIYIQDGIITVPETVGKLPDDLVLNGNIYTAPDAYLNGTKQLPAGLSLNSNIVMTDGSVYFPTTNNNNGVLCAA